MQIAQYTVGPMASNCYILWDEATKEGSVIDPGYPDRRVTDLIENEGLKITKILLTHGHFDHIGGLKEIRELTGAKVYIHKDDANCLSSPGANISTMVGTPMTFEDAEVLLSDGDRVEACPGEIFTVVHTPGHTPGGACFVGDRVMFSGDTLFYGSIGRTDFPGGDYGAIVKSLGRLMAYDDDMRVLTGHGEETTIGFERRNNPFVQ